MATAPSPDQSFPPNPSLPQNETAPDSQRDTGDAIATSGIFRYTQRTSPSLEAYVNFNSSSPPTLLRSERRQAGKQEYVTSCSKLEEILEQALGLSHLFPSPQQQSYPGFERCNEQCRKRKQDVSEGKPIPPEDLIDLTNEPDEENDMEKFTQGFSSSKRRRVEDNKLSDEKLRAQSARSECQKDVVHSPIGHTSPPATQDTAGVPPDPAGSSTSASLTSTGLELTLATRFQLDWAGGVTNHPDGLAPPPPPPPIIILKPASSADPNANPAATADPNTTPSTPPPPPSTPSLILNDSVRAEVHTILETFQGHLNRQKFNQAYLAVHAFIDCRAKTMHKRTPPPELPQFALVQSESSHSAWLKDIQKYLDTILLPSHDEPCAEDTRPCGISPRPLTCRNPKTIQVYLVSMVQLHRIFHPMTAQDHAVKPSSLSDLNNDNLDSHLRILEYLNSCKTSSSPSNPEDGKLRNDMTLKPLYQLHDLIIDIFITYSIIRGSAVADVEPDATSAESQALVVQKKELDKHRSRHNYTPFCLYLVAGVRGLILAPTNRQFASGASALGFLTAVQHIFIKNIPRHEGLEPVWKRLGAYIDNLFIDSFLTPNCLFNFCQPQIIPLAQAITSDFLACVQNQFPAQNFKLPRAVTAK
ncbi:hypothetical protein H4Q26_013585 [Puccinia striiformis f. sp. tritici PST-130]|nr:hypothetical protein H4Q26_013585 [Puccinia striiformis f. sp. tritici PST-130]